VSEIDISRRDYKDDYYRQTLSPDMYRNLKAVLAGLEATAVIAGTQFKRCSDRALPSTPTRGYWSLCDRLPSLAFQSPERPGNTERPGERRGAGQAYPFQVPRAMIPQKIDNMLITGKSIAPVILQQPPIVHLNGHLGQQLGLQLLLP